MKIVGVISSPHFNGNTATLVREALRNAEAEGATVTEVFLPNYQIEFCKACSKCMADGKCPIPDDFEALKTLIYQADGIIWSSPTYAGAPNAMLKRLIERFGMYERLTSSFGGKYTVGISTCSSMGAKNVAKNLAVLASSGIFQRGYVSGILGVGLRGKEVAQDTNILRKARKLGRKISQDIKKGKKYPLQNWQGRLINYFLLKPIFRGAILKNKETLKAVYNNLEQRGLI
jgi:multimeric flavodoxin WrbA